MTQLDRRGSIPLSWVGAVAAEPPYINVGDALSPFIVTMVSGRRVERSAFRGVEQRMAAIGTIGQSLEGGVVDVWGSGCSPYANPLDPAKRRPYLPPAGTELRLFATRGPMSARLLSGGGAPDIPYGDPAALLPRFYAPKIEKKVELGVILHLAELEDRGFVARPRPSLLRYRVPAEAVADVRLITMVAPASVEGVRAKIDEILACRRVVSTSLHGYLLALCYGIPCLYLGSDAGPPGVAEALLEGEESERVNARFVDLIGGYGERRITYYRQPHREPTNWRALMGVVDAHSLRLDLPRPDELMSSCPSGFEPLTAPRNKSIWDHPLIRAVPVGASRAQLTKSRGRALLQRLIGSTT